jgi:nitrogen fixation/metabolism regulation signal transduction histidine kinase
MLASLVGGLALMVAFIGVLGIYFTHKVAGPIYKMKGLLKRVGEGSLRIDSRLRRGDELQDFFDAFIEMVSGLRQIEERRLGDVEAALAALESGQRDDAKRALGRIRETMRSALQPSIAPAGPEARSIRP